MYKIPKGKCQLHVLIDKSLYKKVIEYAPKLYGKGRGGISAIVEEALKQYFAMLESTLTNAQTGSNTVKLINPYLSVRKEYSKFLEGIKELLGFKPHAIKVVTARQVMLHVFARCKDDRTQNKKLHNWYLAGLIKPLPLNLKPKNWKSWYHIPAIELVSQ